MKFLVLAVLGPPTVLAAALALALAFGGPTEPPPLASINNPFKRVEFSDLPAASRFLARDGTTLAFRAYRASSDAALGSVVLVHGSSASSNSMHVMAKAFAAAGYAAYALDIRGHGESGARGHISYIGQLEDDLEDFVALSAPAPPATLAGFSSGGGFVLRVAGSARQKLFANYLLLSPFIGPDAPTFRPDAGGWVRVGLPRIIAIGFLNAIGVHAFDRLPVTRFALNEEARNLLTPEYSYALAQNFRPERDYHATIRAIERPLRLIAGSDDELFRADKFEEVFKAEGKTISVMLVPGIGHIALTLDPAAVQAAVTAVKSMNGPRN
jgi:alpha-beta hydrolase superfamily lysophospholipase